LHAICPPSNAWVLFCPNRGIIRDALYLTDVLQRIDRHPNQQIIELTPRVWKEKFAANPLTSDLEIAA
jgi:hypothetical protein